MVCKSGALVCQPRLSAVLVLLITLENEQRGRKCTMEPCCKTYTHLYTHTLTHTLTEVKNDVLERKITSHNNHSTLWSRSERGPQRRSRGPAAQSGLGMETRHRAPRARASAAADRRPRCRLGEAKKVGKGVAISMNH